MLVGEIVAPELGALLLTIVPLAMFTVALGLAMLNVYLVQAIANILNATVGKLPGVGGLISSGVRSFEAWFVTGWAQAISGLDAQVGHYWHALGEDVAWCVQEIRAGADLSYTISTLLTGDPNARAQAWIHSAIATLLKPLDGSLGSLLHRQATIEKKVEHVAEHPLRRAAIEALKPLKATIAADEQWYRPRVKTLDHELETEVNPAIADLRARARAIENKAIQAFRDAAGVWHVTNAEGLAAAIALAIPALGLQWLNCNSVGSLARTVCGIPGGLLNDLLGLLGDYLIVTNLCDLIGPMNDAYSAVAAPLVEGVTAATKESCGGGGNVAPPLDPPKPVLPPVYYTGTLVLP